MVKRLLWITVGAIMMFVGILATTIALGEETAVPLEMPTLTPSPSPTLAEMVVVQPTVEVIQPTVALPATAIPVQPTAVIEQTVEPLPPTVDPALLPTSTVDPALLPSATVDPALVPTLDPALQPSATLDPAILPSATADPGLLPSATPDPALPTATRSLLVIDPLTPAPVGALPVAPTQPGQVPTIDVTPMDMTTPVVPTATTIAPIDVVQTAVATQEVPGTLQPTLETTATVIAQPSVIAPTATTQPTGQVSGLVTFQNLEVHAGIRLSLLLPDGTNVSAVSDDQGRFAFPNLLPGTYTLEASAHGFLTTRVEFNLTDGQQFALPDGLLKPGDTNEDNRIDLQDVALIAANFNGPAHVAETDLNGDGWVDVSDLSLAGSLFGTSGPLPWG